MMMGELSPLGALGYAIIIELITNTLIVTLASFFLNRYTNKVSVEPRVYKNLKLFMENKGGDDDLFDRLTVRKK